MRNHPNFSERMRRRDRRAHVARIARAVGVAVLIAACLVAILAGAGAGYTVPRILRGQEVTLMGPGSFVLVPARNPASAR